MKDASPNQFKYGYSPRSRFIVCLLLLSSFLNRLKLLPRISRITLKVQKKTHLFFLLLSWLWWWFCFTSEKKGMDYRLLEINLISAQNLTTKPGGGRRLHTYAVAWVDPSAKLRTRVDRVGFENPTWNDKFIFRVTPDFLASDSSAVSVEIYSLGYLRDALIGTVRFLVGDAHLLSRGGVPSFAALQIRSPSGSFDGILNIGAVVLADAGRGALLRSPALGFEDLMGKNPPRDRRRGRRRRTQQDENPKSAKRSEKENLEPEERSDDTVLSDDKSGRRMNSILSKLGLQRKDSPLTSLDENR